GAITLPTGQVAFQNNTSGDFFQFAITNPAAANPTFTLTGVWNAPTAPTNDATLVPGPPADLEVTKSGPDIYLAGSRSTYTFTVTNHGPGTSTGSTIKDQLPAGLTYA